MQYWMRGGDDGAADRAAERARQQQQAADAAEEARRAAHEAAAEASREAEAKARCLHQIMTGKIRRTDPALPKYDALIQRCHSHCSGERVSMLSLFLSRTWLPPTSRAHCYLQCLISPAAAVAFRHPCIFFIDV